MPGPKRIVYILKSHRDVPRFYVGVTGNLHDRLSDHNIGRCSHTARYGPWSLHVAIEFTDEPTALRFERYLKSPSGRDVAEQVRLPGMLYRSPVPFRCSISNHA